MPAGERGGDYGGTKIFWDDLNTSDIVETSVSLKIK